MNDNVRKYLNRFEVDIKAKYNALKDIEEQLDLISKVINVGPSQTRKTKHGKILLLYWKIKNVAWESPDGCSWD